MSYAFSKLANQAIDVSTIDAVTSLRLGPQRALVMLSDGYHLFARHLAACSDSGIDRLVPDLIGGIFGKDRPCCAAIHWWLRKPISRSSIIH